MPNTQSATKAMRQSVTRRAKNEQTKDAYKRALKTFRKDPETVENLTAVFKMLDKAAKKGVIKKNKASRLKSRASKVLKNKK